MNHWKHFASLFHLQTCIFFLSLQDQITQKTVPLALLVPSAPSSAITFCSVKDSCKSPSLIIIKFLLFLHIGWREHPFLFTLYDFSVQALCSKQSGPSRSKCRFFLRELWAVTHLRALLRLGHSLKVRTLNDIWKHQHTHKHTCKERPYTCSSYSWGKSGSWLTVISFSWILLKDKSLFEQHL